MKYEVLSPDGFGLERDKVYDTPEEAWKAFDVWKKRYEKQGYYSSANGRIPLEDLKNYCKLKSYGK